MAVTKEFIRLKTTVLIPYGNNPRKNDEAVADVIASVKQCGELDPIEIDENNVILSGHTRLKAYKKLGYKQVDCVRYTGLTDEQKRKYRLLANKTGEKALWDFELLAGEIEGLDFGGYDFGFEVPTFEAPKTQEIQEDEAPEPSDEPTVKLGDIWKIGNHRLICGDSTDPAVIDRLMDGVKADMVFTDPPYGTTNIAFDKESKVDFWDSIEISSRNNSAKLIFSQQPYTTRLILSNEKEFKYEIIWHKTHATGFLNAKKAPLRAHETICVFYKNQPTYNPQKTIIERNDIGRKKVNGTKAEQYNDYQVGTWEWEETGERYPTDVITFSSWNGARFGDTSNATVHPTQKPINLLSYLIKTYSNDNDIVLDLFGGSGSTLIACEQLNRKCYMAELNPTYCDIIVKRWQDFTGEKAELLSERGEKCGDGKRTTED